MGTRQGGTVATIPGCPTSPQDKGQEGQWDLAGWDSSHCPKMSHQSLGQGTVGFGGTRQGDHPGTSYQSPRDKG